MEKLRRTRLWCHKMRIFLEFSPDQSPVQRTRLAYAFRLFCAIYGHEPLFGTSQPENADVRISYSPAHGSDARKPVLRLGNLYDPRSPREPAPPPRQYVHDGEATPVVYFSLPGEQPDWLGEIFEWVSCADEYSIKQRDSVGRVPFEASYVGRHHLDARVPYAAVAMRLLQSALDRVAQSGDARGPKSPVESVRHFIVPTHDVDYLPAGRLSSVTRLTKNAIASCLEGKNPRLGIEQAKLAVRRSLNGRDPLDQIPKLVQGEKQRAVNASYYFLVRRLHRRDANYTIDASGPTHLLHSLEAQGLEVGVHGSYTCLDTPNGLADEYHCMRERGFHPQGGRQHWLRFTLDRLISALERSGALYDTSIGWAERIGYRAGACFAFPPYNFQEERPATFLEIPLAVMDWTLRFEHGGDRKGDGYTEVAELLATSRRYGWGGVSVLWHPAAFGGAWLAPEMGNIYWRLLDHRQEWNDTWVSAAEFVQSVRQRYVKVGLLPADHHSAPREERNLPIVQGRHEVQPGAAMAPVPRLRDQGRL